MSVKIKVLDPNTNVRQHLRLYARRLVGTVEQQAATAENDWNEFVASVESATTEPPAGAFAVPGFEARMYWCTYPNRRAMVLLRFSNARRGLFVRHVEAEVIDLYLLPPEVHRGAGFAPQFASS